MELTESQLTEYTHIMDWIERYASTLDKNAKLRHLALNVTSYAKLVDVKLTAEKTALRAAAFQIRSLESSYFKNLAISLLSSTGETAAPEPLKASVDKFVVHSLPADRDPVVLVSARPLNEFDAMPELAFPHTETGLYNLEDNFNELSYKDKAQLFNKLLKTEQNIDSVKYQFEVIIEPREILRLLRAKVLSGVVAQNLSPAYGYDIDEAEGDETTNDMLERCFDMSLKLYGILQTAKQKQLAQLAVLGGHRQRFLIEIDMPGIRQLAKPSHQETAFSRELKSKIANKHPLIARYYFGEA